MENKPKRGGERPGAGRPIGSSGLKRRAASHAGEALAALVSVTKDDAAPPDVRVKAATAILDYGLGNLPARKTAVPFSESKP